MTDICCIGHITRDKIITQRPPNTVYCAGGSAFYIAWALQALPQKVSFHMITSVNHMQTEAISMSIIPQNP